MSFALPQWRSAVLTDNGFVNAGHWHDKIRASLSVGECRCGRTMWPLEPLQEPGAGSYCLVWYPARCDAGHQSLKAGERGRP